MLDIKIMVAAHKRYTMPESDIYFPVHVGAEGKESIGFTGDNSGDNISEKNSNYCELTGLYWIWKNVEAEYVGLTHYRRHFAGKRAYGKWERVAERKEIEDILAKTDIILPTMRNYFIESTYSQYAHAHNEQDLITAREIIEEKYPEYIKAFDLCMKRSYGHKFNMFIMKRNYCDEYCTWLFDILFELEKRLDISGYSKNDARVFGFVSERLLDVWIETKHYGYKQMPVVFMEKQNWLIKGTRFLLRKFGLKG